MILGILATPGMCEEPWEKYCKKYHPEIYNINPTFPTRQQVYPKQPEVITTIYNGTTITTVDQDGTVYEFLPWYGIYLRKEVTSAVQTFSARPPGK